MYLTSTNSRGVYRAIFETLVGVSDINLSVLHPEFDMTEFNALILNDYRISLIGACNSARRKILEAGCSEDVAGCYSDLRAQLQPHPYELEPFLINGDAPLLDVKYEAINRIVVLERKLCKVVAHLFPQQMPHNALINVLCPTFKKHQCNGIDCVAIDKVFPEGYFSKDIGVFHRMRQDTDILEYLYSKGSSTGFNLYQKVLTLYAPKYREVLWLVDGVHCHPADFDNFMRNQVDVRFGVSVNVTIFVDKSTRELWEYFNSKAGYKVQLVDTSDLMVGTVSVPFLISMQTVSALQSESAVHVFTFTEDEDMSQLTAVAPYSNVSFVINGNKRSEEWMKLVSEAGYTCLFTERCFQLYNRASYVMNFICESAANVNMPRDASISRWNNFIAEFDLGDMRWVHDFARTRYSERRHPNPVF